MSNQALIERPSKAIGATGNSIIPMDPGKPMTIVPVCLLMPQGQLGKMATGGELGNMAISQQPTTINVQINNNITNNYYSETPNQGHQKGSRDGLNQGPQPTAPASRIPQNRLPGVPSTSNPTHTTDPKCQNGTRENSSTSHTRTAQARPTQVESTPVPTTRPATSQVPSWHQQQESKRLAPTNVPAAHFQGQNHQETQPKGNHQTWASKLFHSDHENGPQRIANFPNPATRLNVSGNRGGYNNRNRAGLAGSRVQRQPNSEAPWHQNQASHHQNQAPHHRNQAPPHQNVTGPPRGGLQSRRQYGGVGAPQKQPDVNQGAGAASGVAKELKVEDIKGHLEHLNSRFEEKMRGGRARLILIGKASALMKRLDMVEKPYHIDVMLDLHATDKRRDCMKRPDICSVFREFKRPAREDSDGPWESFFSQSRVNVFEDAVPKGTRIFPHMQHLQVYLLDRKSALGLELRRSVDAGSDQWTRKNSLEIAVQILWGLTGDPKPEDGGKRRYIGPRNFVNVPHESIVAVEDLFVERYLYKVSNPPVRN